MTTTSKTNVDDHSAAADDIRSAYIVERILYDARYAKRVAAYRPGPKADGGRSRSGRRYRAIWPTIAATWNRHGIDWRQCLAFVFQRTSRVDLPPQPNQLAGPGMVTHYRKRRDEWLDGRTRLAAERLAAQARRLTEAESLSYSTWLARNGACAEHVSSARAGRSVAPAHPAVSLLRGCRAGSPRRLRLLPGPGRVAISPRTVDLPRGLAGVHPGGV